MRAITILPNGAVVEGVVNDTDIQSYIDAGAFKVLPSERLTTWWDNVGFLSNQQPVDGALLNEAATRLQVPKEYRRVNALYGPTFIVGIDKRRAVDLPVEVTEAEVHRLIDLYEDH